jgi:uncharacterized protein YndB with AHSA1/START domain
MENLNTFTKEQTFDAPLSLVWKAWTDAELLKDWWGPDNVTIPTCEVDLRVGGKFYIVMEAGAAMGPYKGTLWPMMATFTVVEPNTKLAYDAEAWTEGMKAETTITQTTEISFAEEGSKTKVTVNAVIHTAGPQAGGAVQGMQMGFTQQLQKLESFLASHK